MPVAGKKKYVVYLEEKNVDTIRKYLSKKPETGGLSALLDKHVSRCASIIEKNEAALLAIKPGKMTVKKFMQLAKLDV